MSNEFKILTVCTGNICRSPLAELLLKQSLEQLSFVTISSAGVQALVGGNMPEKSQFIAQSLGLTGASLHEPRKLTEDILQDQDLILAMDRGHKTAIVQLNPRVTKRVFTVREFARLALGTSDEDFAQDITSQLPVERLRQLVESVGLTRGTLPPLDHPADADVVDPYRQDMTIYEKSTQQLVPAIEATVATVLKTLKTDTLPIQTPLTSWKSPFTRPETGF